MKFVKMQVEVALARALRSRLQKHNTLYCKTNPQHHENTPPKSHLLTFTNTSINQPLTHHKHHTHKNNHKKSGEMWGNMEDFV